MSRFALLVLLALVASPSPTQQPDHPPEKPVRFPLPCDRYLSTDSTLFLMESAPLWLLKKHQRHSFPYQLANSGIGRFFFQVQRSRSKRGKRFGTALPRLAEELKGFDRGFSLALLYFPHKGESYTYLEPEGITLFGQTSNKEWLKTQWKRISPFFADPKAKIEETRPLGASPLNANWLYGTFLRPDGGQSRGALGAVAHARRGSYGGFFTGTYYAWNDVSSKERLDRVLDSGEKALASGLGARPSDRKGARIPGIPVHKPGGTVLGRLVIHLGSYIEQEKKLHGRKALRDQEAFGLLSIQGIQDTVWVEGDHLLEKLQVLEAGEPPSIFEALAPLASDPGDLLPLLPRKSLGFLRFGVDLDWLQELFERMQKTRQFALSKSELALSLNVIRALVALPIPEKPWSFDDLKGSAEIALLLSPPSPGSYWPEIFLLTPKRETRLSPKDRLDALTRPFYAMFLGGMKKEELARHIKTLGKGDKTMSFVNYGKVITENQKESWFSVPQGAFPGAGNFCAAENEAYSILCFTPSAMRRFLGSKQEGEAATISWLPKEVLGQKGDLLQGTLHLESLIPFYPLSLLLAFSGGGSNPGKSGDRPKVPPAGELAKLLGTETFRFYRLPGEGDGRGLLVLDHRGKGLFSPYNFATLLLGGEYLDQLFTSIPR